MWAYGMWALERVTCSGGIARYCCLGGGDHLILPFSDLCQACVSAKAQTSVLSNPYAWAFQKHFRPSTLQLPLTPKKQKNAKNNHSTHVSMDAEHAKRRHNRRTFNTVLSCKNSFTCPFPRLPMRHMGRRWGM